MYYRYHHIFYDRQRKQLNLGRVFIKIKVRIRGLILSDKEIYA